MEIDQLKAMSLNLLSSVLPGDSKDQIAKKKNEGQKALGSLLSAVQGCQTRYGGRTELATEDDIRVVDLCEKWTSVLTHGLRPPNFPTSPTGPPLQQLQNLVSAGITFVENIAFNNTYIGISLWNYSRLHLTRHEEERFKNLKQINTPMGHFRAFLRAALNERSLERYLYSWVGHPLVAEYYEEWSLIRDSEATSLLPNMAAGLVSILFALSIDKAELNEVQAMQPQNVAIKEPIIALKTPVMKANIKKKSLRQVISFDTTAENETDQEIIDSKDSNASVLDRLKRNIVESNWNSAPPTCVNSPDPINASAFSVLSSQSEPTTSDYDNKKKRFFPEESVEKTANETPGQILARLSERAKDIFSSKKSLTESSSHKGSEISSSSGTRKLSESDSEGGPAEGSISCLELCFPDDENPEVDEAHLQAMLIKQQDENLSLQLKMTQMDVAHKEKIHKMEKIILDLNRENDRLKDQLKKYVSAVQMLKNNNLQSDEVKQYESKLVQVAEMHAELMEFNEMLQRKLASVNPPPAASEESERSSNVQLWIPSAFLISNGSKSFHVYQIFIKISNQEWNVFKRYSEFRKLYSDIKNSHPDITPFKFPPKKALGKKERLVVEQRRGALAAWLKHLVFSLPQLRQATSKSQLISFLPFFNDADNRNIPANQIPSPISPT